MIITIDMGTTNTRFRFFRENKFIHEKKTAVGAGISVVKGNNRFLKIETGRSIQCFIRECGVTEDDIECIVASGMACSEHGLCELQHVEAPVSIEDLSSNSKMVDIKEISTVPILMIPGVKNRVSDCSIEDVDMMRGEETEFFGFGINKPCVAIMPGTHTKLIRFDGKRIISCETGIGGELIRRISGSTILKSDLPPRMIEKYDFEYLIKGFNCCEKIGLSKTVFKIRAADILLGTDSEKMFSFLVGAVISCELRSVGFSNNMEIIIGGSEPLRTAFFMLAEYKFGMKPHVPQNAELAAAYGALNVYQCHKIGKYTNM